MRLYYRDDRVQIWNGDARDLRMAGDECAGLVLTSPPWWDGGDYGHDDQIGFGQAYEAYLQALLRVWKECRRCLQPGCAIILWMADMLWRDESVPLIADTNVSLREAGFTYESTYYWHSWPHRPLPPAEACTPMTARPKHQVQAMIIYRKPGTRVPPPPEIIEASRIDPREYRDSLQSVWTPGPLIDDPYGRLIRLWSYVGDLVLDPFAGQGMVCVYAKKLGRKSLGVELNGSICSHAAERVGETRAP